MQSLDDDNQHRHHHNDNNKNNKNNNDKLGELGNIMTVAIVLGAIIIPIPCGSIIEAWMAFVA